MNKLFEMWKWKLLLTIISTIFFTLPLILNWKNLDWSTIIFVYTVFPCLIWISSTYGMKRARKDLMYNLNDVDEIFKTPNNMSRYAIKNIDASKYTTVTLENTGYEDKSGPKGNKGNIGPEGPLKITEIQFMDISVPVYYDEHSTNIELAQVGWRHRNPSSFYTGTVFVNYETGKMTYPDGVVPTEPTHEDKEIIPQLLIVGTQELSDKHRNNILNYLAKQYMKRNKTWLEISKRQEDDRNQENEKI